MILLPIGHEDQRVIRLPWVTILLVVANVAVFLLTHEIADRQSTAMRRQFREVVTFAQEHPYLRLPEGLRRDGKPSPPPSDLPAETLADQQAKLDGLWQQLRAMSARSVYRSFGYIPAEPRLLTLFTSMFMHAGWLHLLGNMLFLWLAGASLEDRWGRVLFPVLYLVSGVTATLIHAGMAPGISIPLVGASGAIAGLMGAFLIRLATTRIKFFYWIFFFRGTFQAPAYVVLPLWLLQQFAMAWRGQAGGVAVWAHIGGFALGVAAALLIRTTGLEAGVLAPAIQKKTTWTASKGLTSALGRLDAGDTDGAIAELGTLLRGRPDNVEARTALLAAYSQKEDHSAAGRESAKLVGAYIRARDMDGALTAAQEHERTYRDVPLSVRDTLFLAAHREKRGEPAEAAQLYQKAITAWPDDPLLPRTLAAYGRIMLRTFHEPAAALELLEQANAHPRATPEILTFSQELITEAREAMGPSEAASPAAPPAMVEPSIPEPAAPSPPLEAQPVEETWTLPEDLDSEPPVEPPVSMDQTREEQAVQESPSVSPAPEDQAKGETWVVPESVAPESSPEAARLEAQPVEEAQAAPVPPPEESAPAASDAVTQVIAEEALPAPPPRCSLVAVSMRAVGLDARGLQLQAHSGGTGRLAWQHVAVVSAACIGAPETPDMLADHLVLDLLMAPTSTAAGLTVHGVRLTWKDLAIPQIEGITPAVLAFQRLVATILKASGAAPYPSREACLGLQGFPTFPDPAAYEADLLAFLSSRSY